MPIVRVESGSVQEVSKVKGKVERKFDDPDLKWSSEFSIFRVYVLDDHEWFDPHTSSRRDADGVSRHAMYGPAAIIVTEGAGGLQTMEWHVNDPRCWQWVGRSIREGYLNAESISSLADESNVVVTKPE